MAVGPGEDEAGEQCGGVAVELHVNRRPHAVLPAARAFD